MVELNCRACGGPLHRLGELGPSTHYRCINCGLDHTVKSIIEVACDAEEEVGIDELERYANEHRIENS